MEVKFKMDIDQHVSELLKAMAEGVYEKEHILAMTLLSAVAGESIFLLGPPGTAKSLVARRLKMIFKDGRAFEYLMSRFSTPDEIVDGFLPSATVVFLDEIWKAGPSIQNALLTAINERIYQNGRTTLQLPMKALIAASNELPAENEGLEALWDRFLVRMVSNCIQSENVFYKMIRQKNTKPKPIPEYLLITEAQYEEWQQKIEDHIRKNLKTEAKKEEVEEMDFYISDRRWKKCVHLLQASAFMNGRRCVDLTDIPILIHCLWNKSDIIPTIIDAVCASLTAPIDERIAKLGKAIDMELKNVRKGLANTNTTEPDEDNYVLINFFYFNVLKYHAGSTLFYKMDYSHVPSGQTCDGVIYYDDTKKSYIIHAIYTGELYDYKIKNTKEARRIKLSKCHGGIIIDNVPYAFQTKKANPEPTIFNIPGSPSPNLALEALNEIRNDLFTKLSNLQRQFNDYRNLFLSDDDMKIVSKYLAQCEKSLKEMEVKAQNASLLL